MQRSPVRSTWVSSGLYCVVDGANCLCVFSLSFPLSLSVSRSAKSNEPTGKTDLFTHINWNTFAGWINICFRCLIAGSICEICLYVLLGCVERRLLLLWLVVGVCLAVHRPYVCFGNITAERHQDWLRTLFSGAVGLYNCLTQFSRECFR